MADYFSLEQYIQTSASLLDKIAKLDTIIDGLMLTAAKSANTDWTLSYILDTGQSKQTVVYRGAEAVMRSIGMFERLREMYIARLNNDIAGRTVRLVDRRNLNGGLC